MDCCKHVERPFGEFRIMTALSDHIAVVTGASSGIGKAIALGSRGPGRQAVLGWTQSLRRWQAVAAVCVLRHLLCSLRRPT